MKKLAVLLFVSVLVILIAGCSNESENEPDNSENQANLGITLSAENITPEGMTVVISQSGGEPTGELMYGSDYNLKIWKNGAWEKAPYIVDEEGIAFTSEGYMLPIGKSATQEITWEYFHGSLPSGKYLLSKTFMDFRGPGDYDSAVYSVEFEIQ